MSKSKSSARLAAVLLVAGTASAAASPDYPFVFGNDDAVTPWNGKYEPSENLKPSAKLVDGAHVHIAVSQYKGTFKDGLQCLVGDKVLTLGPCTDATELVYHAGKDGTFKLELLSGGCLAPGTKDQLVTGSCTDTPDMRLEHVRTPEDGATYYRYALQFGSGMSASYVFARVAETTANTDAEDSTAAVTKTLSLATDDSPNLGKADCGLALVNADGQYKTRFSVTPREDAMGTAITALEKAVDNVKPLSPDARPNIVFFFVDTFRADAYNPDLMPRLSKRLGEAGYARSLSAATSTLQSTYALLNMRPAFEREAASKLTRTYPEGLAPAILTKLGYNIRLFSRPDWFMTFVPRGDARNYTKDGYFTASYNTPLRITTAWGWQKGAEQTASSLTFGLPFVDWIAGDQLRAITSVKHDQLVIADFKKYLADHATEVAAGGNVFIVYLSSLHSPQIPVAAIATNVAKTWTFPQPIGLPYDGLWSEKSTTPGTITVTKGNPLASAAYERVFDTYFNTGRTRFARTYYNQVLLVDQMLDDAITTYESQSKARYLLTVMGDHGEMLGEHGVLYHGHRPSQKVTEAPILLRTVDPAKASYEPIPVAAKESEPTVSQMDIFPALIRTIAGDDAFTRWTMAQYLFTADARQGCHLSAEPHGSDTPFRFAIYDTTTRLKTLWFAPGGALASDTFYATDVTDYWDNPLDVPRTDKKADLGRCLNLLLGDRYK